MSQKLRGLVPYLKKEEIDFIVEQMAKDIERHYEGKELVVVCPLKGSVPFVADLIRKIHIPMIVDFVYITSPKGESCRIVRDLSHDIQDKHVLIVEEIIDAGRTLNFLKARVLASNPASLRIATLLDKPARRELPLQPDFVGRQVDDRFVVGYGMDSEELGRNYKDIYNFVQ